jgi:uncharacterized protein YrzB (UPF0473 family)
MSENENSEEVEGPAIVFLMDDEGREVAFALLAMLEVQDKEFAVMIAVDQLDDAYDDVAEVFLFRHQDEGGGQFSFSNIDDDDLYMEVQAFCDTLDIEELVDAWAGS